MSIEHKINDLLEHLSALSVDIADARGEGILQLAAERDRYWEALGNIQQGVGVSTGIPGEILRDPKQIATQALRG